jgi:hypothetical protein
MVGKKTIKCDESTPADPSIVDAWHYWQNKRLIYRDLAAMAYTIYSILVTSALVEIFFQAIS